MKTKADYKPHTTLPSNIMDMLSEQISYTTYNGRVDYHLTPESMKLLLNCVYEHIERQALEVYKSNEPWVLKAWAYQNVLKDVVPARLQSQWLMN